MPIYEYECRGCGELHEFIQKFSDSPKRKCPSCGKLRLKKLISAAAFHLKGDGWYVTDFRDKGKSKDKGKSDSAESSSDSKSDSKSSDSKSTESKSTESKSTESKSTESKSTESKSTESDSKGGGEARRLPAAPAIHRGPPERPRSDALALTRGRVFLAAS